MISGPLEFGTWVMGVLLAVIGFFLSFYFYRSVDSQDKLRESVNKLQITLTGLNAMIIAMQEKSDLFASGCSVKHSTIDNRLNEHGKQLDDHEKKITELSVKVEYLK